jgi:phage-related protein
MTDNTEAVVISTHGLMKKTDKTHQGEIDKAENIRRQYFNLKINRN